MGERLGGERSRLDAVDATAAVVVVGGGQEFGVEVRRRSRAGVSRSRNGGIGLVLAACYNQDPFSFSGSRGWAHGWVDDGWTTGGGAARRERDSLPLFFCAADGRAAAGAGNGSSPGTGDHAGRGRSGGGPPVAGWVQRADHQRRLRGDRPALGAVGDGAAAELFDGEGLFGHALDAAGDRGQRQPGRERRALPGCCAAQLDAEFHAQLPLLAGPRSRAGERCADPECLRGDDGRAAGAAMVAAFEYADVAVRAGGPVASAGADGADRVQCAE